jgi:hypothetical protein
MVLEVPVFITGQYFFIKKKELKASLSRRKEKRALFSKKVALSNLILLQLSSILSSNIQ